MADPLIPLVDTLAEELDFHWRELHEQRCDVVGCNYKPPKCELPKPEVLIKYQDIDNMCQYCHVNPRRMGHEGDNVREGKYCSDACKGRAWRARQKAKS